MPKYLIDGEPATRGEYQVWLRRSDAAKRIAERLAGTKALLAKPLPEASAEGASGNTAGR